MAMFPLISPLLRVLVATIFFVNLGNAQAPEPLPRPAPAPKLDLNSPANAGRANLTRHLDTIAAGYLAARATDIAAIHTQAEAEGRQVKVRKQILSLIGDLPERTPLNARTLGTT